MPITVRELQMRISGSLTGFGGLGTMAATDFGAPLAVCWSLIALTFVFLAALLVTTIRPDWTAYVARELSGAMTRFLRRGAPPHAV